MSLNGRPLLVDFDVLSEAGGAYRAFTRVFKGVSPSSDGMVHLKFIRQFDQPIVNAIELVPEVGKQNESGSNCDAGEFLCRSRRKPLGG